MAQWKAAGLSTDSFCSEGEKAHGGKFEKLFAEGDSYDGDAPEDSGNKGSEGDFPAENDYPEDIEKSVAEGRRLMHDFLFERKCAEPRYFKTLDSRRKTDYGYAKEDSRKNPFEPEDKSAENEPENIS